MPNGQGGSKALHSRLGRFLFLIMALANLADERLMR